MNLQYFAPRLIKKSVTGHEKNENPWQDFLRRTSWLQDSLSFIGYSGRQPHELHKVWELVT